LYICQACTETPVTAVAFVFGDTCAVRSNGCWDLHRTEARIGRNNLHIPRPLFRPITDYYISGYYFHRLVIPSALISKPPSRMFITAPRFFKAISPIFNATCSTAASSIKAGKELPAIRYHVFKNPLPYPTGLKVQTELIDYRLARKAQGGGKHDVILMLGKLRSRSSFFFLHGRYKRCRDSACS
jgi:hypothetical protein